MTTITHVALWTRNLEAIASFWSSFFGAEVGEIYESRRRPGFRSRFLTLGDGPAFEIMEGPWVGQADPAEERTGLAHVALSLGSEQAVEAMAARAEANGILVAKPRWTGDAFYEAVVRDPDGNLIEITI